jgi:tetratricopeptide (TPR) repeat protein/transcriptional regulator with XRE-family HTH domain
MAGSPSLAVLLRTWRERALLTQAQLAARAGLGVRTIRRIESSGLRRPRADSVRLLADALDLTTAERALLVAAAGVGPAPYERPHQLPAPPSAFIGRAAELADLDRVGDTSTVVITAIDGMAGIGKTALAVHTAHRLADRYPDGQLFVDLHGYTQGMAPLLPGEALDRMLRALGVAGDRIPADLDERAGLYRSRLADRRMLILLDNAATEAQVAPLLPGTAGCLVLVTSRRRLTGLDQTHTISLDTLPLADAVTLFIRTLGGRRLADQPPELVAETVELCGRLPLAIRIAAARLRSHPSWDVSYLTHRLRDHQHRLAELAAGQRSVAAALDLSYQQLTKDLQRTYRLLGLHPGPDLDTYAAAALNHTTVARARRLLHHLLDVHLIQEPTAGRFRFHDLVRAHAASSAAQTKPEQRAGLTLLFDYYRHTAAEAMDTAYPYEREHRPRVASAGTPTPRLRDPIRAAAWLDVELTNLLAAARHAAEHGWPTHTWHLSTSLHRHLLTRGHYHDAETLHRQALTAARTEDGRLDPLLGLGDIHRMQARYEQAADDFGRALKLARRAGHHASELKALLGLGQVHRMEGRYQQAIDTFQRALDIALATGSRAAKSDALNGLGRAHMVQCRYQAAIDCLEQALDAARAHGNHPAELSALLSLGDTRRMEGMYDQAIRCFESALAIARDHGYHTAELHALLSLGDTRRVQGRYDQATDCCERAMEIAIAKGDRPNEIFTRLVLGNIQRLYGRHEQAIDSYRWVLARSQEMDNRNWQFEAIHGIGRLEHAAGSPESALACLDQALSLATDLRQPDDQARAHEGLASAHQTLGHHELARYHYQQTLDILLKLDLTRVEDVNVENLRTNLAALDQRAVISGCVDPCVGHLYNLAIQLLGLVVALRYRSQVFGGAIEKVSRVLEGIAEHAGS